MSDLVSLEWKMHLKTKALNGGKEMTVDGMSLVTFGSQGKAISHRDYFDMGEFVYEKIPVLKASLVSLKTDVWLSDTRNQTSSAGGMIVRVTALRVVRLRPDFLET